MQSFDQFVPHEPNCFIANLVVRLVLGDLSGRKSLLNASALDSGTITLMQSSLRSTADDPTKPGSALHFIKCLYSGHSQGPSYFYFVTIFLALCIPTIPNIPGFTTITSSIMSHLSRPISLARASTAFAFIKAGTLLYTYHNKQYRRTSHRHAVEYCARDTCHISLPPLRRIRLR